MKNNSEEAAPIIIPKAYETLFVIGRPIGNDSALIYIKSTSKKELIDLFANSFLSVVEDQKSPAILELVAVALKIAQQYVKDNGDDFKNN